WRTRGRGRHLPGQAPETKSRVAPALFSVRTLALKEGLKKASRSPDSEMKPNEMSDRKRAVKTWAMICAGAAVFVFILQYSLTLSLFQLRAVVGLLGLALVAAAFWIYKFYLRRAGARARKDDEVTRLH